MLLLSARGLSTACVLSILAWFPVSLEAGGLPPGVPASQHYRSEHWTVDSGLPYNRVTAAVQSPDGFLWLGLGAGLVRFDGIDFKPVPWPVEGPLPYIRKLMLSKDGAVWIGTRGQGCFLAKNGSILPWEGNSLLASKDIRSLLQTRDGSIWIGSANQLVRYREGRTELVYPNDKYPKTRACHSLLEDGDSAVYAGT